MVVTPHLDGSIPFTRDLDPNAAASFIDSYSPALNCHYDGPRGVRGVIRRGRGWREHGGRRDGQKAAVERLGEIAVLGGDRVMHGDEVRPHGEGSLDLDLVERAHDAGEHVPAPEHRRPDGHEIGHCVLAITDELLEIIGDEGLDVDEAERFMLASLSHLVLVSSHLIASCHSTT